MNHHQRTMMRSGLACLLFLALASCGGLLESGVQPERTFWLEPMEEAQSESDDSGSGVLTVRVTVIPGLDSDHLLTIGPGPELGRIGGARWPENTPEHVESLLIRSLANSGLFARVTRHSQARLEACDLELEFDRFYTRLDSSRSPHAVEISASGIHRCGAAGQSIRLSRTQDVQGSRMTDVVQAHQRAMDALTRELLARLADLPRSTDAGLGEAKPDRE